MHYEYLTKNTANNEVINLIYKYSKIICEEVFIINIQLLILLTLLFIKPFEVKKKNENEDLKKAYKFLAYLIDNWFSLAWVISKYQIEKKKNTNNLESH